MNCSAETLLKRYLEAVAVWLPAEQREDIAAELADDLRAKISDREASLGRNLGEDDLVPILKSRGNPIAVAAGYSSQAYLIGPSLFPIYRLLVKLVIFWIQLPLFALIIGPLKVLGTTHPIAAILNTAGAYWMAAIAAFTVITLTFGALERSQGKLSMKWDPRRLSLFTLPRAILDTEPALWTCGVAQAVFSMVFALGWQYTVQHWNSFGFGAFGRALDPVLHATYWPLILCLLTGVAQGISSLFLPRRKVLHSYLRLANAGLSLIVIGILFRMRVIETIGAPFIPAAVLHGEAGFWIHFGLQLPLLIIGFATLTDAFRALWVIMHVHAAKPWVLNTAPGK